MTTLTPTELRAHARTIILDHAGDIEALSISEYLEDLELSDTDHDTACEALSNVIATAVINVIWPEDSGIPDALLLQLLRRANRDDDLDVAESELLDHHRTQTYTAAISSAYAAGIMAASGDSDPKSTPGRD